MSSSSSSNGPNYINNNSNNQNGNNSNRQNVSNNNYGMQDQMPEYMKMELCWRSEVRGDVTRYMIRMYVVRA
eukprot:CAMPEP_0116029172 /NCGR_PEP_ID=MMETSP0321-20121206/15960_1 /TAXON_ID=163516 /ORGANISM="Leptocylindrus danicus var. danicus, Strain B650" /LENGTH=71 /DNA_ID=CAMNT_0003503455 /DNA_START=1210 /DNA_END=1425 /DNA_ORIENTATION=+